MCKIQFVSQTTAKTPVDHHAESGRHVVVLTGCISQIARSDDEDVSLANLGENGRDGFLRRLPSGLSVSTRSAWMCGSTSRYAKPDSAALLNISLESILAALLDSGVGGSAVDDDDLFAPGAVNQRHDGLYAIDFGQR